MRTRLLIVLFILPTFFAGNEVFAAPSNDVAAVVLLMQEDPTPGVIFREVLESGGIQIVFIARGLRYTLYYSNGEGDLNFLSVWVRPNGTYDSDLLDTFTDHRLDGAVNFGISGGSLPDVDQRLFDNDDRNVGEEFQEYWQSLYDTAIADALHRLR